MAAVTLLTFGTQSDSGSSTPLDVSAAALLRLDVQLLEAGGDPTIDVFIETAKLSTGPWQEVWSGKYDKRNPPTSPYAWPSDGKARAVVTGPDAFVRARWTVDRNTASQASISLGVTGVSVP